RKVADDTGAATEPAFSPDGSRLAYVATRDGQPQIWVMDADGSNPARLTNAPGPHGGPVFTADGQGVVYHALRTGHQQIFAQSVTGSDAIQLTQEPNSNSDPTVSPDGETIAFVSNREGNSDIWLMSRDGSNQRAFTHTPQMRESAPAFLRDGSLAYLVEQKQGGRTLTQVARADLATGRVTPLTGTDLSITDFAVTPGGDLLALVVTVGKGLYRIYVVPVGQDVATVRPGDRVMLNPGIADYSCEYCRAGEHSLCRNYRMLGEHLPGTLTEAVVVPEQNVAVIPTLVPPLSWAEAAAFSLVTLTAWRMLVTRAQVRAGETVLIWGIGGGVALAALRIAK